MKTFGKLTTDDIVYVGVRNKDTYSESIYNIENIEHVKGISGPCVNITLDSPIPTIGRTDFCLIYNHGTWSTIPTDGCYTVIRTFKLTD